MRLPLVATFNEFLASAVPGVDASTSPPALEFHVDHSAAPDNAQAAERALGEDMQRVADDAAPKAGELPVVRVATDIEEMFTYHTPRADQIPRYEAIRTAAKALAYVIKGSTQVCADQSAAIRLLREAVMTANAAIALEILT